MRYISATKGAAMVLPVFVILALVIPKHESLPSVELILTVSTFLFAIMGLFPNVILAETTSVRP